MKKLILFLALVLTLAFTGCSCLPTTPLAFGNDWNSKNALTVNTFEELKYKVEFMPDFVNGDYNYSTSITLKEECENLGVEYNFTNGEKVERIEILPATSADIMNKESDIFSKLDGLVVKYTSNFKITANYKLKKDKDFTSFNDYVKSTSFFIIGATDASFTPVYSKTEYSSTLLDLSSETPDTLTSKFTAEFKYNSDKYTLTLTEDGKDAKVSTYNYTYKQAIDASYLTFAIRNTTLLDEASSSIPTISASYGEKVNISVKKFSNEKSTYKLNVNGVEVNDEISVDLSSFIVNNPPYTGTAQLLYIQADKTENLTDRALVIKYVEPISTYGTYLRMGSLVHTLESVSFGN